jgi:hypothetical protein
VGLDPIATELAASRLIRRLERLTALADGTQTAEVGEQVQGLHGVAVDSLQRRLEPGDSAPALAAASSSRSTAAAS